MKFDLTKYNEEFNAEDVDELDDQMEELYDTAIESFEKQYGSLSETSIENAPSEDGGIYAKEYWADEMVTIKDSVDMNIKVGGWISMDLRNIEDGEHPSIFSMMSMSIDGESVGAEDCKAFMGYYTIESNEWNMDWDNY